MRLPLIVLLPLLAAWLPLFAARFGRRTCALATVTPVLIALALLLSAASGVWQGTSLFWAVSWLPTIGLDAALRLDGLAWLFALLILGIGTLIVLYAHYYLPKNDDGGRFFSLLLLFMGAMLGIVTSDNLLLLVLFWELTSISSFLLIGYEKHQSGARKGARMALTITGLGGLALLAGVILLGQVAGSYSLQVVLDSGDLIKAHRLYPLILTLVLLGAFTKSAQFPFQFWLPHAMSAPTPVSAYLHSATMVKAGVFLLARLSPALGGTDLWIFWVCAAGLVTLVYGAVTAMFRHDLKGLLAFSTISHLGLITLLLGMSTPLATVAALFHIVNHATFKASLFMAAGIIDHEAGTRDMRILGGLKRYLPHTALLGTVAAAAMAGVPLLNGFLSKEMFFAETLTSGAFGPFHWLIPVLAVVAGAFSVAYSVRFIHDTFYGPIRTRFIQNPPHEPPRFMRVPVEILVVLCVAVGLVPVLLVAPLLTSAVSATLNGPAPDYSLDLWHGFNLPLLMSAIAMAAGLLLYRQRHRLHAWHATLPVRDARLMFEATMQRLQWIAGRFADGMANGSMQRYLAVLIVSAIAVMAWPLWGWYGWTGSRPLMPLDPFTLVGAIILIVSTLGATLSHRLRLVSLLQMSGAGLIMALTFARFSAPDLALTQLTVEFVTVVFMMLALFFLPQTTPRETGPVQRARDILLALVAGMGMAALSWAVMTRPADSISDFFIRESVPGGGGTNVVNVILVDFRGFDTLGEVTVLAIAALGVYALLYNFKLDAPGKPSGRYINPHPLIMTIVSRPLLPMALTVGLYLLLRGHNMPGGGFIAGLVTAVALILQFIGNGLQWSRNRMGFRYHPGLAVGLMLALFTGVGSMLLGYPFLTSTHTHIHLPLLGDIELASAMLFDFGVFATVVCATLLIIGRLGQIDVAPSQREAG